MAPDLLDLSDWNHQLANFAMFGVSRTGAALLRHDLWMTHCGFPETAFNVAFLKYPGEHLEATIQTAEPFFAAAKLPFCFMCRSDREELCAEGLAEAGYRRGVEIPMMLLDPIRGGREAGEGRSSPTDGLEIQQVESAEDLEAFQQTAFLGFGLPEQAGHLFLTEQLRSLPNTQLYLGLLAGEPVWPSTLIATGPVAGIYWVATLEAQRGRGHGEAVTWAAVRGGVELGCRFASLQASTMGAPAYSRMGFQNPAQYVRFEKPDDG
jgi:hypothetical protein